MLSRRDLEDFAEMNRALTLWLFFAKRCQEIEQKIQGLLPAIREKVNG